MFRLLFSGLTATVLIAFGLFLVYSNHRNTTESAALLDRGVVVDAVVTKVEWQQRKSNNQTSLYTASLRFQTREGRVINTSLHVSDDVGRALANASSPTMKVSYMPDSPMTVRAVDKISTSGETGEVGVMMALLGGLMLLVRFILEKRRESHERRVASNSRAGAPRSKTYSR